MMLQKMGPLGKEEAETGTQDIVRIGQSLDFKEGCNADIKKG